MQETLRRAARTGGARGGDESGQGLVEFALAVHIVFLTFLAILELALGYNAFVGVNRASQQAAHLASIAGNQVGTDCLVLRGIEEDIQAPLRDQRDLRRLRYQTRAPALDAQAGAPIPARASTYGHGLAQRG